MRNVLKFTVKKLLCKMSVYYSLSPYVCVGVLYCRMCRAAIVLFVFQAI